MNEMISIVVPVYRAKNYIAETIATVEKQTYTNWELLLVDDCSNDGTLELMKKYESEKIKIICQSTNKGAAEARNRGVLEAKGRYLAFLDADDLWNQEKLEKEIAFMKEKNAAFVFLSYEYGNALGKGNGKIAHVPDTLAYKEALKNTIIFTSTVLFDLTRLSKEEILMPAIESEDTATWWRILRSGHTAYGLDEPLVIYRRPAQSLSSNKWKAIKRVWNLYRSAEKLSIVSSAYYFIHYAVRTCLRRI